MPIVAGAFRTALLFVVVSLLETQDDAIDYLAPIFELNSASHQCQSGRPVFFWGTRVLFRNRRIVARGLSNYKAGESPGLYIRARVGP